MSVPAARARVLELVAIDVAELAADYVRSVAGQAAATGTKSSPTDIVTQTDLRSEELIRRELQARSPGSSIAGEEFDDDVRANNVGWIVDPIDGTVNYLYDLPVMSVSIAATIDGEVVAGAVVDVLRDETYSASRQLGARRDGADISVNDTSSLGHALIGTGFSYDADIRSDEAEMLTRVLPASRDIRCMGSAALNLCWVGSGRLDGFYERDLKVYDYSAGALVASEAGAAVEHPHHNADDLTVAATPKVFGALRSLLDDAGC